MIKDMFRKPTKWSVLKTLILKDIDDLIIGSLGIVAFIAFFVGGVVFVVTTSRGIFTSRNVGSCIL